MKKNAALLGLLLILSGCGDKPSAEDVPGSDTASVPRADTDENLSPTLMTGVPADSPDKGIKVEFTEADVQAIRRLETIVSKQGVLQVAPYGNADWASQSSQQDWRNWAHRWQALVQHNALPAGTYQLKHWPKGMAATTNQRFQLTEAHKALLRAALWDGLAIHPKRPFGSENEDVDIADILGEHYDVDAMGNPQLSAAQQQTNWQLMRELPLAAETLIEYAQLKPGSYTVYYLNPETP